MKTTNPLPPSTTEPEKIENRSDSGQFRSDSDPQPSTLNHQLIRDETSSWKERAQHFRLMEWLLHAEMLEAAHQALHQFRKHPGRAGLRDVLALYKLAFDLGRRACGLPLDPTAAAAAARTEPPSGYPGFEAALKKIYGQPLPPASGTAALSELPPGADRAPPAP